MLDFANFNILCQQENINNVLLLMNLSAKNYLLYAMNYFLKSNKRIRKITDEKS